MQNALLQKFIDKNKRPDAIPTFRGPSGEWSRTFAEAVNEAQVPLEVDAVVVLGGADPDE